MKKKIKDLEEKELDKICYSHSCSDCPLNFSYICFRFYLNANDLDKEIEI